MKRLLAGLAVAAAVVVPAAPAAAEPIVQTCGSFTPPWPCGVCIVDEWGYCVWF